MNTLEFYKTKLVNLQKSLENAGVTNVCVENLNIKDMDLLGNRGYGPRITVTIKSYDDGDNTYCDNDYCVITYNSEAHQYDIIFGDYGYDDSGCMDSIILQNPSELAKMIKVLEVLKTANEKERRN